MKSELVRKAVQKGKSVDEARELEKLRADKANLLASLEDLRKELRAHFRLDVRKHYSLMVADAAAGTAIAKAKGE